MPNGRLNPVVYWMFFANLLRVIDRELHRLANFGHVLAGGVLELSDDVEGGLTAVAAFDEGDLRAGDDRTRRARRSEVVGACITAEVIGLQVNLDVGGGQIAGELLLELALALVFVGVLVVGGGVVAGAVFELYVGAIDFDGEPAVAAVFRVSVERKPMT